MRGARQENGTFAEQYFLNWMHGSGLITTGFARLFSRFATDVRHRSLNSLANVDAANRVVPIPKCPPFLRLGPVARYPVDETSTSWDDFRLEILDLARLSPLAFDIVVSETNPVTSGTPRVEKSIGRLTLGSPVVSTLGDRQLHFTHRV
jgi:hypothetical protein